MVILGIDPGYAIVGYGVIEYKNSKYLCKNHGAIFTNANDEFLYRLEKIFDEINKLIDIYKPEVMSIEKLYFQNNHKTAIDVAQARGVILLAAKKHSLPVYEYTPLQIKSALTGYGKALKPQVMQMVKKLLMLEKIPKPDDTADALAAAICHSQSIGRNYINELIMKNKNTFRSVKLNDLQPKRKISFN